jgi:hypothetical protein
MYRSMGARLWFGLRRLIPPSLTLSLLQIVAGCSRRSCSWLLLVVASVSIPSCHLSSALSINVVQSLFESVVSHMYVSTALAPLPLWFAQTQLVEDGGRNRSRRWLRGSRWLRWSRWVRWSQWSQWSQWSRGWCSWSELEIQTQTQICHRISEVKWQFHETTSTWSNEVK